jgi:chorismate mutase
MTPTLSEVRARFDEVDERLVRDVLARLDLADLARAAKAREGKSIVDLEREQRQGAARAALVDQLGASAEQLAVVEAVFAVLVDASRRRQAR